MSESINWANIGLKRNPFNIVPDKDSQDLIWAGFPLIKEKFEDNLSESLNSIESNLTLVISQYGGGKTHSSFYYSKNRNLPINNGNAPFSLIVQTPKDGSNAADEFYTKIIDRIKFSVLSSVIRSLKNHYSDDQQSLEKLQEMASSEDLGRIIWLLGDSDDDISFLAEQILCGTSPNATVKTSLRIRRGVQSNSDKAQILSCLFQVLANFNGEQKLENPRRILLWIDEIESLIFYTSKQYRPFTQTIRELIDFTPTHLSIFMNFSFADPENVSNVEIVIGEALIDRINSQIIITESTVDESVLYVKDLLKHYQIDDSKPDFYPLDEEIVRDILERGPNESEKPIIPRSINKWFQYLFRDLNKKGYLLENMNIDIQVTGDVDLSSSII